MSERLNILHCLRAPVGGLFRHVRDLAIEQAQRGHAVGVLVDSEASDALTEQRLQDLAKHLELGLHRTAISRSLGWRDVTAVKATQKLAKTLSINVLHGHGAKGGACARLAAIALKRQSYKVSAFYTPHGGSLHYGPRSLKGRVFTYLERVLAKATDGLIFESQFARDTYEANIGANLATTRVIPNGLHDSEFTPVEAAASAADFVFIGELRMLKGVDVLLEALSAQSGETKSTCVIVGDGPDREHFETLAQELKLMDRVVFKGSMPAREAFQLGRALVMPSRKESLPYIILEAAAARLPLIATNVGGIPEIVANTKISLIEPDDRLSLAQALTEMQNDPEGALTKANDLRDKIKERFTVTEMTSQILDFYDVCQTR